MCVFFYAKIEKLLAAFLLNVCIVLEGKFRYEGLLADSHIFFWCCFNSIN